MKRMTRKELKAAALFAMARARKAGTIAVERAATATDAALIEVGKAAAQRQRRRNVNVALRVAGKAAMVAGTAVAAAMVVRAARARKVATT